MKKTIDEKPICEKIDASKGMNPDERNQKNKKNNMGEYAKYNGQEVKIGTCESMYYIRFKQRGRVEHIGGNVNLQNRDVLQHLRFRFPFPDEDGIEVGAYANYDKGVEVPKAYKSEEGPIFLIAQKLVGTELWAVCRNKDGMFRLPKDEGIELAQAFLNDNQVEIACRILDGYRYEH